MVTEPREEIPLLKLFEPVLPYQTSIYATVLNIIQCIALGFLINEVKDTIIKGETSFAWVCRSLVALGIILVVWERYVSELQYLWSVSWFDTLIPFFIGMIECLIVFSTNVTGVPLGLFISSIGLLQFWVATGYWYTYSRRKDAATERLYQAFYASYPNFVIRLMNFLKGHDFWNFVVFLLCSMLSLLFFAFIILLPYNINELIFPIIYLCEIVQGERVSLRRGMRRDEFLGPYFQ